MLNLSRCLWYGRSEKNTGEHSLYSINKRVSSEDRNKPAFHYTQLNCLFNCLFKSMSHQGGTKVDHIALLRDRKHPPACEVAPTAITSFLDLLHTKLPKSPEIYAAKALNSTREPATYDLKVALKKLDRGLELFKQTRTRPSVTSYYSKGLGLIYAPTLLDSLVMKAAEHLDAFLMSDLDDSVRSFLDNKVHPYLTTASLSPVINSEKDMEKWVIDAILSPALLVHQIEAYHDKCGEVMMPSTNRDPDKLGPYWASAVSRDVIPDVILVKGGRNDQHSPVIVEVKTSGVCENSDNPCEDIFEPISRVYEHGIGALMWLNWPADGTPETLSSLTSLDKIIIQVWSQLNLYNANMAILSWYGGTVFFLRCKDNPGNPTPGVPRLVFSPVYKFDKHATLLAVYAWIAKALQKDWMKDVQFEIPKENHSHWNTIANRLKIIETAGLCRPTYTAG
ncbi:hypothetical protein QCA50_009107 [Cerrena zonata]|uniref:CDAN1-interacting nuclease 1 n=1 Tax=Cerrena zonata TaxID=2478898 RepID=A0AAW0GD54_9APHY